MALHAHNDDASINDGQATTGTATLMEIFWLNQIHKWTVLVRDYGNLSCDGTPSFGKVFGFFKYIIYIQGVLFHVLLLYCCIYTITDHSCSQISQIYVLSQNILVCGPLLCMAFTSPFFFKNLRCMKVNMKKQ